MEDKIKGLVLREVAYKESDKILTLLTEGSGIVSVKARGARKRNSPLTAGTQMLTYSAFQLYEAKGQTLVREADPIELFMGLRSDLIKISVGSYFAQILELLGEEDHPNDALLKLGLNALYALASLPYPESQIKAAFELKTLALSGFQPDLTACRECDSYPHDPLFSYSQGAVFCSGHESGEGPWAKLTPSVLAAMNFVLLGDEKRLFSFSLEEKERKIFSRVCEGFFLTQTDHHFTTLDFLKSINFE